MTILHSKEINRQHALDPKPGDYWQEMLHGVCAVIAVTDDEVIICKTKKRVDNEHWTWDLTQVEDMSKSEFYKWLEYDTIPGSFWCSVWPENHKWVVEAYAELHNDSIAVNTDCDAFWHGCPV